MRETIGIVGGTAWPSSVVYYRTINALVAQRLGGLHCAKLVLAQTDFQEIERRQREGRWDLVGDLLAEQGNILKAAGADFFLLACNTVHTADQRVESAVDLPFIHIVDPTARRAVDAGFTTVGLLGSRYTMTGDYFVGRLQERYGLNVLVAEGEHQDNVHNALYDELAKDVFLPETRVKFRAAIADLVDRGAEVIILGCTEFGMLVEAEDSPVPIIDTTLVHAEAAVDMALSDDSAHTARHARAPLAWNSPRRVRATHGRPAGRAASTTPRYHRGTAHGVPVPRDRGAGNRGRQRTRPHRPGEHGRRVRVRHQLRLSRGLRDSISDTLGDRLHLIETSIDRSVRIERVDLLIANLIIEYVGAEEFVAFAAANARSIGVLSCVIQCNDTAGFVSSTDDSSSFDVLASVSSDIDPEELTSAMSDAGFLALGRCEYPLPNGKTLVRQDFQTTSRL